MSTSPMRIWYLRNVKGEYAGPYTDRAVAELAKRTFTHGGGQLQMVELPNAADPYLAEMRRGEKLWDVVFPDSGGPTVAKSRELAPQGPSEDRSWLNGKGTKVTVWARDRDEAVKIGRQIVANA